MPSHFNTLTPDQLQPQPRQTHATEQYGVYVVPAVGNGRILTQNGTVMRGLRALPGGAETNALEAARARGLASR